MAFFAVGLYAMGSKGAISTPVVPLLLRLVSALVAIKSEKESARVVVLDLHS